MNRHDPVEPLSPDIQALLDAERQPPSVPNATHARLIARVEATTAKAAASSVAAAGAKSLLIKLSLAVVAAGGLTTWAIVDSDSTPVPKETIASSPVGPRSPRAQLATEPASPEPTETAPASAMASQPAAAKSAASEPGEPAQTPGTAPATPVAAPPTSVAAPPMPVAEPQAPSRRAPSELELISGARAALADGSDASIRTAGRLLATHQRAWPDGQLAEERAALSVRQALAAGDTAKARRLRDDFRTTYPNSIHRAGLDALTL